MREFEDTIRELRNKTQAARYQFLRTELQTCFIAVDRARLELSLGDIDEAEKEFEMASRGRQVIERFLSEAAGRMSDIQQKLTELKASLRSLRADLDRYPG